MLPPHKDPRGFAVVIIGIVAYLVLECLALAYQSQNTMLWTTITLIGLAALVVAIGINLCEYRSWMRWVAERGDRGKRRT